MDKYSALQTYFGFSSFRDGQECLIDSIIAGRDTLGVMPTGAGKSMCYQLPALLLKGLTLVVSPLISLMDDQVAALTEMGIPAAAVHSGLSYPEFRGVMSAAAEGKYRILYVAPERLLSDGFIEFARASRVSLLTIDEAHCISRWGQDFRPSYLRIAEFAGCLPERPVIAAFTATATAAVREDISAQLGLRDPFVLTAGFDRPNLRFIVRKSPDRKKELLEYVRSRADSCGIVYCATRKQVEEIHAMLSDSGVPAFRYHAGLSDEERRANQERFIYDETPVMVATNAFGMGINKPNVAYVIHYSMPKNIESYYQEAGRAGRDGNAAECILFYNGQDAAIQRFLITSAGEDLDDEEAVALRTKDLELLRAMTFYCQTTQCLRSYMLGYFGETSGDSCGNCSNCLNESAEEDVTIEAQKILSCIVRMRGHFGMRLVIDTLRGSKNKKVTERNFDTLSTWGILASYSEERVRQIIVFLVQKDLLCLTNGDYPVLTLTPESAAVLSGKTRVLMKSAPAQSLSSSVTGNAGSTGSAASVKEKTKKNLAQTELTPGERELYERLRRLRTSLASQEHVPAYIVFGDVTLIDMCSRKPVTTGEFREVTGVGDVKCAKYGPAFLQEIRRWRDETGASR